MESRKPVGERIFYDPFAQEFFGGLVRFFDKIYTLLMKMFGADWLYRAFERKGPGVFGFIITRARYIDDYLQSSIDEGIEQLVILGAGYDSRAYRFDGLKDRVKVFEVDHPATQQNAEI